MKIKQYTIYSPEEQARMAFERLTAQRLKQRRLLNLAHREDAQGMMVISITDNTERIGSE